MVEDDDDHGPFLDPDASFAAAQSMGRDTGDPIAVQPKTLHRRLQQAGLLLSIEEARKRLTVRRTLGGARRAVLHLSASVLEGTAQTARPARTNDDHDAAGPVPRATAEPMRTETAHEPAPDAAPAERGQAAPGTNGPIGPVLHRTEDPKRDVVVPNDVPAGAALDKQLTWTA